MAPKMGRASVPAESAGAGMFRHIIFTRGRTAPPSRGSPRARHFTDLLSVGVGIVPPRPVAVFGSKRDFWFFRRFLCEEA